MREVEYKKSFDRSYLKLPESDQDRVDEAIRDFLTAVESGEIPKGLGLKRLRGDLWEIRADIRIRVGFCMRKSRIEFGIVGSHASIRQFLRHFSG